MPVDLTVADIMTYLGGTGGATPRTFYGLTVEDATIESRALEPAELWINQMLSDSTLADKASLAKKVALARAAQHLLGHLRTLLLAGGKVNSYSIGNMSVTKQDLLALIRDGVSEEKETEGRLLPLLLAAGERQDQTDLKVENPIADSEGTSRVDLDSPAVGGFAP